MPLCADLSHFVVGREFSWPITDLVQTQIEQILDRSTAFQGRNRFQRANSDSESASPTIANGTICLPSGGGMDSNHGASVPEKMIDSIFSVNWARKEYAMTGADGYELSDRWQEALMIKQRVRQIWDAIS